MISSIKLIAFKAVDNLEIAQHIYDEHKKRLAEFNITTITSSCASWLTNPSVYCIYAIDEDRNKILGAIRIHLADPFNCLPIEDALSQFNVNLRPGINKLMQNGMVAESCGLWCTGENIVKKINLSTKLFSFETAICRYLNVQYCFGFGPSHNLDICFKTGFRKHEQFPYPFSYPNEKYQSWVLYKNPISLKDDKEDAKLRILINDPHLVYRSEVDNNSIIIKYELLNFDHCLDPVEYQK
ncbi:MAG: hypothetical protein ABI707_02990 [Ferruginibacter sp.]